VTPAGQRCKRCGGPEMARPVSSDVPTGGMQSRGIGCPRRPAETAFDSQMLDIPGVPNRSSCAAMETLFSSLRSGRIAAPSWANRRHSTRAAEPISLSVTSSRRSVVCGVWIVCPEAEPPRSCWKRNSFVSNWNWVSASRRRYRRLKLRDSLTFHVLALESPQWRVLG
jgi:hypothetical protein